MPKDSTKYRYFQVAIEWDSWTLAQLEQDAVRHQMADIPAKLIVMRLTEYYELIERMQQAPPTMLNGHLATKAESTTGSRAGRAQSRPDRSALAESDEAGDNAEAALEFFRMDDDDE